MTMYIEMLEAFGSIDIAECCNIDVAILLTQLALAGCCGIPQGRLVFVPAAAGEQ